MHDQHQHHRDRSDLQVVGSRTSGQVSIIFLDVHTFGGRGSPAL